MTTRARILTCLAGSGLAVFALIPFPYLAAPRWDVWVVDEAGAPIDGMTVRRVYRSYSTESEEHTEDQVTDKRGYAAFPVRWSSASTPQRCEFTVLSALVFVHASFGSHAYVFAFGNGKEGSAVSGQYVTDWTGELDYMRSRIQAEPLRFPAPAR
jgi:hypothetical protein